MGKSPLDTLQKGGKAALAEALSRLETHPEAPETLALLEAAWRAPRAQVVGVTGPPGVGKSSLLGALIGLYRAEGRRLGILAVDPSSRRSGGALLGDRLRLKSDPADDGLFIRSMAARDRLGGLAEITWCAGVLFRALFDLVLIETVGVGQSETEVAGIADTLVFCIQPESGDSLQFMKAGIVELPDIALVTKADLGASAERALADLEAALTLGAGRSEGWELKRLLVSAARGEGLAALRQAIETHRLWLSEEGRLAARRQRQAEGWLRDSVRERFGREGLGAVEKHLSLAPGEPPFARLAELAAAIRSGTRPASRA